MYKKYPSEFSDGYFLYIFLFGELIRPWDIIPNHANRKPQVCIPKNR